MVRDHRRLAAIVSADVAGYSRLMGRDDSGTLARLKAHRRELIDPKVAEHDGRIVKSTGDGLLLEFPSVVDAVRCAVEIQRGMAERNATLPPDQRIDFRIGINVGDIIIDGDDIFGDGVNVAARIEALAEPGQICVSKVVRDQVMDKLSFNFEDIGARQVKNIARPIEVYSIRDKPPTAAAAQFQREAGLGRFFPRIRRGTHWGWLAGSIAAVVVAGIVISYVFVQSKTLTTAAGPPSLSMAVMPFTFSSASAEDERFVERVTQDLTSALERAVRYGTVVSYGLVAKYKDKSIDPRIVGHDLNVRYLVEGALRNENGAVFVMAQLVETASGTQVWSGRLTVPTESNGNSGIVTQLTNRLRPALFSAERKRLARLPLAGANATELVLHANALWDQDPSFKGRDAARKLYDEAVRRDPTSVLALVYIVAIIYDELNHDPHPDVERLTKEMDDFSSRAIRADRDDPNAWLARSDALLWQKQWDGALEANAEALRIDPYRILALRDRAKLMHYIGRPEEALPILERAIALDPRGSSVPELLQARCSAYLSLGNYDDAIAACKKSVALEDYYYKHVLLSGAYAQKGELNDAAAEKAEVAKLQPNFSIATLKALRLYQHPTGLQKLEDHLFSGLRKAGFPEQ